MHATRVAAAAARRNQEGPHGASFQGRVDRVDRSRTRISRSSSCSSSQTAHCGCWLGPSPLGYVPWTTHLLRYNMDHHAIANSRSRANITQPHPILTINLTPAIECSRAKIVAFFVTIVVVCVLAQITPVAQDKRPAPDWLPRAQHHVLADCKKILPAGLPSLQASAVSICAHRRGCAICYRKGARECRRTGSAPRRLMVLKTMGSPSHPHAHIHVRGRRLTVMRG